MGEVGVWRLDFSAGKIWGTEFFRNLSPCNRGPVVISTQTVLFRRLQLLSNNLMVYLICCQTASFLVENKKCRGTGMSETSEKAMLPNVYLPVIFCLCVQTERNAACLVERSP